ncbi:MAG: PEP/pyruvate-binding domain-containing protein [Bacillota bacterium]|nr:PEP/pyruvate-binding domain-containing protein [Bacillota bacterium]
MIFEPQNQRILGQIGGKAFQLAELAEAGFSVPPFFVLTQEAFRRFLGEDGERLQSLLSAYELGNADQNREAICSLIRNRPFPAEWKESVLSKVMERFGADCSLAVRSSAVDEDGDQFSFAGMMESFLKVKGGDALFDAIRNCYLSCFSERAMRYRKENGLLHRDIAMAVILQEMVDADVSGVMFTSNPGTNNPDELLISVLPGLGEALVSGEKDGFDALYDRFGSKLESADSMPLSDETLQELVRKGLQVEDLDPKKRGRDIEFSVKDGKIYLLQNRVITSFRHIEKNRERTVLDNSNIIESYSGVTTPLTFTFAREVYEKIYRQTLGNFFIEKEAIERISDDLKQMIVFYENKIYYRLNSWYKMTALYPGYQKNKRYMEEMMGVKVELKETEREAKVRLFRIYLRFFRKLLGMKRATAHFAKKFRTVTAKYMNSDFSGFSNPDLVQTYKDLETSILNDFTTPIVNDMGAMVFLGKVNEFMKKEGVEDAEGLLGKVLSRQGNMQSVNQSLVLLDLVSEIREDEELAAQFRTKSVEELRELLDEDGPVYQYMRDYIDRYGARVMDELKLESITLRQNPDFFLQMLKNYLQMDEKPSLYQPARVDEGELYRQLPFPKRVFLKRMVKITKYFVRNRELLRFYRTYIYDIVRMLFLRIGHNLEEEGVLSHYRDVFFLTKEELFSLVEGQFPGIDAIPETIAKRKRKYEENKGKEAYERMYFYGEVKAENMIPIFSRQEASPPAKGVLKGVAGGGQVVTGRVKFVENPSDADVEGYILMAKRTDPGWTVLFPMAKAILIERGSVLSHSAVIAREMGIPLVVGIRGLTEQIKDGMLVRVDGVKGTVERVEEGDETER